jgi:HEAT repeat protein
MKRLRVAIGLLVLGTTPYVHADKFNWEGQIELDATDLHNDDPKKRADAVRLLAMDDIHLSQPFLMKALGDADISVRHEAAKALGLGGSLAAVPAMVDWLADTDAATRAVAAEVLGDIGGPDATAALVRSLGDTDPAVRQKAVRSLGKIGLRGNLGVVIALIPRLEDDKADVRRETVDQLEQLGDRRAVIPLVSRFNDTSREVVKEAVAAVGKLGDPAAVPALVRLMSDSDETVRTRAVEAIGQLGAVEAIDALSEQLSSGSSDTFHTKVAYALGQIAAAPGAGKAGEDAMRVLVENLAVPQTRNAAREALKVAGKAAVPALVAHLTGRLKGHPETAVLLLADNSDARATAALAAELERGRVATPLVLKALGATHDPNALVAVLGQVASKDATIRLAAMEALRPLLGSDARAGDVLVEHLGDDDLEVRVLAAEYLGDLRVAAAAPKLAALAGPGNPPRLRTAAIDALGELGPNKASPGTSKVLVDVLRDGPNELHFHASTALANLADPATIPALIALAQAERGPTRQEVVRALGGSMRDHGDPAGRKLLRDLASDGDVKVAVAAICGLAAVKDPGDAQALRALLANGAADRQRAAAWALGELHDTGAFGALADALSMHDDRLVGDAAWALGELAAAAPTDPHVAPLVERWLYLGHHGGWAAAVDATAALARTLWALPHEARAALVGGERRAALTGLAAHKSRLVRIDAVSALGAVGDDAALKTLSALVHDDPSPHVRAAAAMALGRAGDPHKAPIAGALDGAAKDSDPSVQAAAKAALAPGPHAIAPRAEWRTFYVVDTSADDARVRQQPYFIDGPDGLIWATYTDARGEITSEHMPAGVDQADVWAASREPEY